MYVDVSWRPLSTSSAATAFTTYSSSAAAAAAATAAEPSSELYSFDVHGEADVVTKLQQGCDGWNVMLCEEW